MAGARYWYLCPIEPAERGKYVVVNWRCRYRDKSSRWSPGRVPKPEIGRMKKFRETALSLAVLTAFLLVLAAPFRWLFV